jgi:hypothetical protein
LISIHLIVKPKKKKKRLKSGNFSSVIKNSKNEQKMTRDKKKKSMLSTNLLLWKSRINKYIIQTKKKGEQIDG